MIQGDGAFFSNDQWGLLKVLVVVVMPIILAIGTWIWRLDKNREKTDITNLGSKVDDMEHLIAGMETQIEGVKSTQSEDRLAFMSQLHQHEIESGKKYTEIQVALARIEEKMNFAGALKIALRDAVTDALREAKKDT